MINRMSPQQFVENLHTLLAEVERGEIEVILEKDGEPVAALVSPQAFEDGKRTRQAAVSRFVERGRRVRERVEEQLQAEGKSWEDLDQAIMDEVNAVRREWADSLPVLKISEEQARSIAQARQGEFVEMTLEDFEAYLKEDEAEGETQG